MINDDDYKWWLVDFRNHCLDQLYTDPLFYKIMLNVLNKHINSIFREKE